MKKQKPTLFKRALLGLLTALLVIPYGGAPVMAASHREAPLIALDPAADITDFYAFRSWENPDRVVFILNVIPGQEPSSAPNYFNFDDSVYYEIHIDNDKDNVEDIIYQVRFQTEIRSPGDVFPLSYVAVPPITALDGDGSQGLLLRQSYVVTEFRPGQEPRNLGKGTMFAVPSNVGPRTMPKYDALAAQGIYDLANGGRVFAGQRDETFYIDLGGTFDTLNLHVSPILSVADDAQDDILVGDARDSFSGFNISTIAIEVPISEVQGPDGNMVVGAYGMTSRRPLGKFVQVGRMANPLVNELIIPTAFKDGWNATPAFTEGDFIPYYCNSALAVALNLVFGTSFPTQNREDLVNVLTRYAPGPAVCSSAGSSGEVFADLLRLDMSVPPTPAENQKRLGILAHNAAGMPTPDPAGWPNGRRPNDDITDVALRVVAGVLLDPVNTPRLGDGVNFNIGAGGPNITNNGVSKVFPFLPRPHDGRDRRHIDPGEKP